MMVVLYNAFFCASKLPVASMTRNDTTNEVAHRIFRIRALLYKNES